MDYIWWIIATMCAFFVKGLCGFANSLVFTTMMSFRNNNINISPIELVLGYPSNVILAWKERKSINWKICVPLAILVIGGSIPGAFFLKNTDSGIIKIILGIVILLIGIEMLLRELYPTKMKESKILLGIIGVMTGLLCGIYGIGALLGVYVNRVTDSSKAFKANICSVFLAENTFRIILYMCFGILTWDVWKRALSLTPFMLLGLWLGMWTGKVLDEKYVKKLVVIMLIISGIALVVKTI